MRGLIRLALGPAIIPAYTVYGAAKAGGGLRGLTKGAMIGALFGITYVLTGERLDMEARP